MGYMGVYSMGVTANLSLTIVRHDDGCVIMSWSYDTRVLNLGDCVKLPHDASFWVALEQLSSWMALVEAGPTTAQELWEALQLPFELED